MAYGAFSTVSGFKSLYWFAPSHVPDLRVNASAQRAPQHNPLFRALPLGFGITQQGAAF